jgi:hypothetical protein
MSDSNKRGVGQHRSSGGGALNSGMKQPYRDPEMGKGKAVPGSRPVNSGVPIHGEAGEPRPGPRK